MLLQPMMSMLCLVVVTEGINLIDFKNQLAADIKELERGTILKTVTTFDMQLDNVQFATSLTSWWNTIDCDSNKLNLSACNIRGMTEYYGKLIRMITITNMKMSNELLRNTSTEIRIPLAARLTFRKFKMAQNKSSEKKEICNIKKTWLGFPSPKLYECRKYFENHIEMFPCYPMVVLMPHTSELPLTGITEKECKKFFDTNFSIRTTGREEDPTKLIKETERGLKRSLNWLIQLIKLYAEELMKMKEVKDLVTFVEGKLAELEKETEKEKKKDQEEKRVEGVEKLLKLNELKKEELNELIKVITKEEVMTSMKLYEKELAEQKIMINTKIKDIFKIKEVELDKVMEFKEMMNETNWKNISFSYSNKYKLWNLMHSRSNKSEVVDLLSSIKWRNPEDERKFKELMKEEIWYGDEDGEIIKDYNYVYEIIELIKVLKANKVMTLIESKEEQLGQLSVVTGMMTAFERPRNRYFDKKTTFIQEKNKLMKLFGWEEEEPEKVKEVNELMKLAESVEHKESALRSVINVIDGLKKTMNRLGIFIKLNEEDLLNAKEFKELKILIQTNEEMLNEKVWDVKEFKELEKMKKLREDMKVEELKQDVEVYHAMNLINRNDNKGDVGIEEMKKTIIAIKDLMTPLKWKERELKKMEEEKKVMEQMKMTVEVKHQTKLIERTKSEWHDMWEKMHDLKYYLTTLEVNDENQIFEDEDQIFENENQIFVNSVSQKRNLNMPLRSCDVVEDEWKCAASRIQDVCESENHNDACYYIEELNEIKNANIDELFI